MTTLFQTSEKAVKILKKLGFVGGNVDPSLYVKMSEKGMVYVALYVDDDLMLGDIEAINEAITSLKKIACY